MSGVTQRNQASGRCTVELVELAKARTGDGDERVGVG